MSMEVVDENKKVLLICSTTHRSLWLPEAHALKVLPLREQNALRKEFAICVSCKVPKPSRQRTRASSRLTQATEFVPS